MGIELNDEPLKLKITQVFRDAADHTSAISKVSACLRQSLGGEVLLVVVPHTFGKRASIARHAEQFFSETTAWRYRSLYTVAISSQGREWGRLAAFFAWGCSHERLGESLAELIGHKVEALLEQDGVQIQSAA